MKTNIQIEKVSLQFRVYHEKGFTLKDAVIRMLTLRPATNYTSFWALKDVSLNIKEGERIGIVGRNGAGKSCLLKTISKVYQPTRGKISVKGRIAPLIEVGAGFHPELTGRENIFLNGAIMGHTRKEMNKKLDSIVAFAEIDEFLDTQVKYYSTGMYLRLAFSIATEVDPEILIIDEIFAGGDQAFIKKATNRMTSLIGKAKILLIVSHDEKLIRQFSNRVVILDGGHIIEDTDTHKGLSVYRRIMGEMNSGQKLQSARFASAPEIQV